MHLEAEIVFSQIPEIISNIKEQATSAKSSSVKRDNREQLLLLKNNGNVGIGTAGPNFLLDVAGKANVTGIITNEASGAITTCNVGEMRGNATANKICLCTTANNWKCAAVS